MEPAAAASAAATAGGGKPKPKKLLWLWLLLTLWLLVAMAVEQVCAPRDALGWAKQRGPKPGEQREEGHCYLLFIL